MTQNQLDRARQIEQELRAIHWTLYAFSADAKSTNSKPRLGKVKRKRNKKGLAFYTINDNHNCPVDELVIPDSIKFIIYSDLKQYESELKKEFEQL